MSHSIASFTDDDRRFLTAWFRLFPVAPEVLDIAEMLCEQGSAASAELDDLFLDATAFDTSCGDPDDPDMVHYDPFDRRSRRYADDFEVVSPQHSDAL